MSRRVKQLFSSNNCVAFFACQPSWLARLPSELAVDARVRIALLMSSHHTSWGCHCLPDQLHVEVKAIVDEAEEQHDHVFFSMALVRTLRMLLFGRYSTVPLTLALIVQFTTHCYCLLPDVTGACDAEHDGAPARVQAVAAHRESCCTGRCAHCGRCRGGDRVFLTRLVGFMDDDLLRAGGD